MGNTYKINEKKLKIFLINLLTWTSINDRPDVKKVLLDDLDKIFEVAK